MQSRPKINCVQLPAAFLTIKKNQQIKEIQFASDQERVPKKSMQTNRNSRVQDTTKKADCGY